MSGDSIGNNRVDTAIEAVRKIALAAGYSETRLSSSSDRLVLPVKLEETRLQYVYIQFREDFATEHSSRHEVVATVFSTCHKFTEEDLHLDMPELAWELLKVNSKIPFGRYAAVESGENGEFALIVSCDHVIDTMDPPELAAMVEYIARIADRFEVTHNFGADDY